MADLEIDESVRAVGAEKARARRDALARAGLCINGANHDKPATGVRCDWCKMVHRFGVIRAQATDTKRPANYRTREIGGGR